ncbi:tetratricopeptide repeat protein [Tamlana haliotis]|uniref:Tetratricopeptide repeat protein n=1 Tax=Pseudotamlana haliotis TaxID=2614804 RepID=A0A6N6MAT7_9FLAO|nr:tetratricopeptide repeat protein [Tamlana haliotis]KAB1066536.1 tetratricopeptide repeat protein [Tamlana haliotis]
MNRYFKVLVTCVLCAVCALSCSRKKDRFISRNYHAVTAEYNTLFNGYNALEAGKRTINDAYFDNYWEVLPVERMQISEDILLPGQSRNENFNIAEDKAAKAIQKHGMHIDSKEKNPQIDEAYLLLGKARYFDQRFIPALEAFNYILYKYPASDKINRAKIWREKTNMRLDNNELAIHNLKRLLKYANLEDQDLADATSTLAQAYINTKVIDTAITQLGIAAQATKSHDERGRYHIIQGQLYNQLGQRDSANIAFDKVIELNRKTPRIYLIAAQLGKINNFDHENGNKLETTELLTEIEKNRENRPYLDKIYHQIGLYHQRNENEDLAIRYYNKSLRTNTRDAYLKSRNYEILGDIYFDNSVYAKAGLYYDSTMTNMAENSKPFRVMKRKRDNLEDVILYEGIAKVDDSIIRLVNMPDATRTVYFKEYIDELKRKEEEARAQEEAAARNSGIVTVNNQIGGQVGVGGAGQAVLFYFYNPTTVAYGKNEFVKTWGDRTLEDDWRWSTRGATGGATIIEPIALADVASDDQRYDPEFYISQIPSDEKEIDSISKARNYAYYQLGLIYKEKFKEYELSKDKFQDLLESHPEERLILPSKYNLYKLYELLGQNDEAEIAKTEIVSNYPDSRYAHILENPELVSEDENSPQNLYEALYIKHENQEYEEVISKCDEYINQFDGDAIAAKFELLKATATGRLYGFEAYKEAVNRVAVTYANTDEGKQAKHIVAKVLPNLANKDFVEVSREASVQYKVIFQFDEAEEETILRFKKTLDEVLKNIRHYYVLSASIDVYDPNTTLVVVHGIKTKQIAQTFNQILLSKDQKKIKAPYFVASSTNYQIIQVHKNLDSYLNLYNK